MASRYKVLAFDMDGTLVDSMWAWRSVFKEFIRRHHLNMPDELKFVPECPGGKVARMLSDQLDVSYDEAVEEMGSLVNVHYGRDVEARTDAPAFLKKVRSLGYHLVLATATPLRYAHTALRRLDLEQLFDLIVSCEEIGVSKSDPQFYLRLAERLCVRPEECVMFEDALYSIRSAKKAGFAVCAVEDYYAWRDREEIRKQADRYIACFQDLLDEMH